MSSIKKTIWSVCAVVLVVACVVCLGPLMWRRPGSGQEATESFKIEVDAATRATPRRLAAPLEITNISTYEALNFDRAFQDYGTLSYELSKPAWVRIRLVARGNEHLVLRTLVDWSERKPGKNIERWDGRDATGYLVDQPCRFVIEGDNAEHAAHDRSKCGEMLLQIAEPSRGAVLASRVMVRVVFAGVKQGYVAEMGATLRVYMDYVLSGERRYAAPAAGPFEWEWDTTAMANGSHLVTINLNDGYDHVGTASVEVEVRN